MLGDLSARYESNGNCGCISNNPGDAGGKSYGMYQFASKPGTLQDYCMWLVQKGYWFGKELRKYQLCSKDFDAAWKWLAQTNTKDFAASQHEYIKSKFYDIAIKSLFANNFHIEKHVEILKDVVWSRAVQYGPYRISKMFLEACKYMGYPNLSYIDDRKFDKDLIKAIYLQVCSSYEWNHGAYKESLNQRFKMECQQALNHII